MNNQENKIYCYKCGTEVEQYANYCPKCGANLNRINNVKEISEDSFRIKSDEMVSTKFNNLKHKEYDSDLTENNNINVKIILQKGLLWALIATFIGFIITEYTDYKIPIYIGATYLSGNSKVAKIIEYDVKSKVAYDKYIKEFYKKYKKEWNDIDKDKAFRYWVDNELKKKAIFYFIESDKYNEKVKIEEESTVSKFKDEDSYYNSVRTVNGIGWSLSRSVIAIIVGLFLGIGEGIYYGSKKEIIKYALIGAGITMLTALIHYDFLEDLMHKAIRGTPKFIYTFVRCLSRAIIGLGIGLSVGCMRPEKKRVLFCSLGGFLGGFVGEFIYTYIYDSIPNYFIAQFVSESALFGLIGIGVFLFEQRSKLSEVDRIIFDNKV